jgi:lanthanide-dependent methanol dehydrogenase
MLWRYEPGTSRAAIGVACCDVVNRGAAYYDGRIYFNTLDNYTIAVDASSARRCGARGWATSTAARA